MMNFKIKNLIEELRKIEKYKDASLEQLLDADIVILPENILDGYTVEIKNIVAENLTDSDNMEYGLNVYLYIDTHDSDNIGY